MWPTGYQIVHSVRRLQALRSTRSEQFSVFLQEFYEVQVPYSVALLYDEPMAGLDAENALIVHRLLRKAVDDGAAVLLATHEQGAEEFADRVM